MQTASYAPTASAVTIHIHHHHRNRTLPPLVRAPELPSAFFSLQTFDTTLSRTTSNRNIAVHVTPAPDTSTMSTKPHASLFEAAIPADGRASGESLALPDVPPPEVSSGTPANASSVPPASSRSSHDGPPASSRSSHDDPSASSRSSHDGPQTRVLGDLDISSRIAWEDGEESLERRASLYNAWLDHRRSTKAEWVKEGKPNCPDCGKVHHPPHQDPAVLGLAFKLGTEVLRALKQSRNSAARGGNDSAQDDAKSIPLCGVCGKHHWRQKRATDGCRSSPSPCCGLVHPQRETCAMAKKRYEGAGIIFNPWPKAGSPLAAANTPSMPPFDVDDVAGRIVASFAAMPAELENSFFDIAQHTIQAAPAASRARLSAAVAARTPDSFRSRLRAAAATSTTTTTTNLRTSSNIDKDLLDFISRTLLALPSKWQGLVGPLVASVLQHASVSDAPLRAPAAPATPAEKLARMDEHMLRTAALAVDGDGPGMASLMYSYSLYRAGQGAPPPPPAPAPPAQHSHRSKKRKQTESEREDPNKKQK